MIVFDLDDTLLTSDKRVSDDTAQALVECKKRGMLLGYITARSPRKTGQFLKNLPCDFIAYYNGAVVYAGDSVISSNSITFQQGLQLVCVLTRKYPTIKVNIHMEPYSYFENTLRHIYTGETKVCAINDLSCGDIQRIRVVFDGAVNARLDELMADTIYYVTADKAAIIINKNAT